ncbi:YtpI family protein [Cohnella caldifontis]|uniref:YtpI family protein n=1 Tax=Cohnella caldifontis TaxID=3027471 RepID=UPI0023EAD54E|nr:YtpI family protein [Cohnella sp. YIM B05605]
MVNAITWVLGALIVLSCIGSVVFSFRYRRSADGRLRGLYAARMNVCMGLMLVFIALIQMFLFSGSTLRVVIGAVFLLLGLFNLFAGLRNHSHFSRMSRP